MKKIIFALVTMFALTCTFSANAQSTNTMTAKVVKTDHKSALKAAASVEGKFYFKTPDKMCLTFNNGKEALLMTGTTYTLVRNGKKSVAKGAMIETFRPLQTVLKTIITKGNVASLKKDSEIVMTTSGKSTVVTITPAGNNKRALFTSFVVTYNTKTYALESLRMNGRKTSYTDYVISGVTYGQPVADTLFK